MNIDWHELVLVMGAVGNVLHTEINLNVILWLEVPATDHAFVGFLHQSSLFGLDFPMTVVFGVIFLSDINILLLRSFHSLLFLLWLLYLHLRSRLFLHLLDGWFGLGAGALLFELQGRVYLLVVEGPCDDLAAGFLLLEFVHVGSVASDLQHLCRVGI